MSEDLDALIERLTKPNLIQVVAGFELGAFNITEVISKMYEKGYRASSITLVTHPETEEAYAKKSDILILFTKIGFR